MPWRGKSWSNGIKSDRTMTSKLSEPRFQLQTGGIVTIQIAWLWTSILYSRRSNTLRSSFGSSAPHHSQSLESLDDLQRIYRQPSTENATKPRKILTISTLKLHRAINDKIRQESVGSTVRSSKQGSTESRNPEVFPFDAMPRKKFVGGGGVISHYENPFRYWQIPL